MRTATRLNAPLLASVAVQADDAALAEAVVAAHVPLSRRACRARNRIGPAHDPDDQIATSEARSRGRREDLAETLMTDDQSFW